jgi:Ca2+-binding EF-hand superfamily protein
MANLDRTKAWHATHTQHDRLAALCSTFYQTMDVNGDGELSVNEFILAFRRRAKRLKKSGGGGASGGIFDHPIQFFEQIDTDQSGSVSEPEFVCVCGAVVGFVGRRLGEESA